MGGGLIIHNRAIAFVVNVYGVISRQKIKRDEQRQEGSHEGGVRVGVTRRC